MKTVKEFMSNYYKITRFPVTLMYEDDGIATIMRPRIICNDGYSVSVQASANHYCSPRDNDIQRGYDEVELGFPNIADELINDYAEDDDYTQTVYGWVPIDVVEKLVEKHGGIKGPDEEQMNRMKENAGQGQHVTFSW